MLSRILPAAAIMLLPLTATAGPKVDLTCDLIPGSLSSCSPLIACIPEAGIYFTGRALGWGDGTFAGETNAGFGCTGSWMTRNFLGLGQAVFECDNDLTGAAYFTYQDNATGTVTGSGAMSNGLSVQVWSGHNVRQFLINEQGDVDAQLICGDLPVPIS